MKTRLSIAALCLAFVASAQADPPLYRIQIIGPVGADKSSMAYGINDQGQVVGASYSGFVPSLTQGRAIYWNAGSSTLIGGGITGSEGFDINNSGQAAVQSVVTNPGAYRYNATTNTLTPLEGTSALARGISGNGMIAGAFGLDDHRLPVFWGSGSTTMSLLNTQSGNPQGFVQNVNGIGEVVGRDDYTKNPSNAFSVTRDSWVYQNGSYLRLTRPEGDNSEAFALSNNGKAAGIVSYSNGQWRTALWDYSSGTATATFLNSNANRFIPSAINDSGTIIGNGFQQRYATNFQDDQAFLYQNGTQYDLNTLLDLSDPLTASFFITGALDINNAGQIVGLGVDADFNEVGFIATPVAPVPEPTTLLALGGLFGAYRLRRRSRRS